MSGPADLPLFNMMKARMDMLGERQKVLAQNVANVSTPGYVPDDVNVNAFNAALQQNANGNTPAQGAVRMATTHAGHIAGGSRAPLATGVSIQQTPDSETTLDGNSVVVEEQMMKMAETRMEFETMIGLYNKSLSLMRIAIKSPR